MHAWQEQPFTVDSFRDAVLAASVCLKEPAFVGTGCCARPEVALLNGPILSTLSTPQMNFAVPPSIEA